MRSLYADSQAITNTYSRAEIHPIWRVRGALFSAVQDTDPRETSATKRNDVLPVSEHEGTTAILIYSFESLVETALPL
jgi:hypothetical protein